MNILEVVKLLLEIPLFTRFDQEELYSLVKEKILIQDYGKNEIIYLQNEKALTMDIILFGEIIVQNIDRDGNILSIVNLGYMDILGGNLIFSKKNEYPMTVIARGETRLLRMERELILELCQVNKAFLKGFLEVLSDKASVLTNKINTLAIKTIREKLMDFLLFESNRQGSSRVKLYLSKKELAEKFGVERPSLQRELRKMKEDGIIDYDAWTIELKNQ